MRVGDNTAAILISVSGFQDIANNPGNAIFQTRNLREDAQPHDNIL